MDVTTLSFRPFTAPRTLGLALVLALALSGCFGKSGVDGGYTTTPPASSSPSGSSKPVVSKPYTVMGQTYYPLSSGHGYTEEGVASWYGKDFHGKKTANGETYNMHGMTAAHKILPFGTQLRVTNLDNNRFIMVRVNDRGPFVANRIIDLTKTGAEQLDMIGPGTARVRLESVGAIPGQTGTDLTGSFYVQIGSFSVKDNAHRLAESMAIRHFNARVVFVPDLNFHRVQIGPYSTVSGAENAAATLQGEFPGNFVVAQ